MSTALVWLRRDLRLADQPALAAAARQAERILPLYIHAPEEREPEGGAASRWWLHHSLAALQEQLAAAGNQLCLDRGASAERLRAWAEACGAEAVHATTRPDPAERHQEQAVQAVLAEIGVALERHPDGLLTDPERIRNRSGRPYRVFTPFWRSVRDRIQPGAPAPAPPLPPPPATAPASRSLDDLGLLPRIRWDTKLHGYWRPGEGDAQRRLTAFCEAGLGAYPEARDWPSRPGTSRLSPSLYLGELSLRTVWDAVTGADRSTAPEAAVEAFLGELGWREFAYHLLAQEPELHRRPVDRRFEAFSWRPDPDGALLAAWQRGATGIPLVDAGMRELWETGWLHNRVRMVVGSFLVKNLRLPWQLGEAHFRDTLVDWDPASNSMGWQWVAGCGADAAPYFRIFNPVRQGQRFDPDGDYVRRWVPELSGLPKPHIHQPWAAPADTLRQAGISLGITYPRPIVDLAESRREALAAYQSLG